MLFQSTLPVGGATSSYRHTVHRRNISIHAPRGGSDVTIAPVPLSSRISIHAPRGGSDSIKIHVIHDRGISIHAPRGGSDLRYSGAVRRPSDFNPRSPWGERQLVLTCSNMVVIFQSTLPVGGATAGQAPSARKAQISIHAPRGGSDVIPCFRWFRCLYFNPRSPWGERRQTVQRSRAM